MTEFLKPDNPGVYIQFASEATQRPLASVASTMSVVGVHDWGPLGTEEGVRRVNSFGEFDAVFGNSQTDLRKAVLGAFVGSGVPGQPGAGSVLIYRIAKEAARSTVTLSNTGEPAEEALKVTAKYAGVRGDRISLVVEQDPGIEANHRIRVLFDGLTQEKFSYPKADIAALAAVVNARSKWITAEVLVDEVALAETAGADLAGGGDGEAFTGEDWTNALSAIEFEPFSVFAGAELTSEELQASTYAWAQTQADQMRPIFVVFGGPEGESLDEAIIRTESLRDPHVVSLGAGDFTDDFLGGETVTTAGLASRVAGSLAGLSEERSLTNLKFAGLKLLGPAAIPTERLLEAKEAGVTAFRRTSSADAELKINWGVTTFIDDTIPSMDPTIFSDPRLVRIIDLFIRGLVEWGDDNIVGNTVVNAATMAAVRSEGISRINALRDRGLILPGETEAEEPFFTVLDPQDVGAPADSIPFEFGWLFGKTTNYLIGNGRVR